MKPFTFSSARFLLSCLEKEDFPCLKSLEAKPLAEIAIVGRSNVGKSSLINHLLHQDHLAKVSSKPGKTQMLNFFLIDEQLLVVDLPGFGYANASFSSQKIWSEAIDNYLNERKELRLILQLLDIRHLPSKEDQQFYNWALHHKIPVLLVLTKKDKIPKTTVLKQTKTILASLSPNKKTDSLTYSIKENDDRKSLIAHINQALSNPKGNP